MPLMPRTRSVVVGSSSSQKLSRAGAFSLGHALGFLAQLAELALRQFFPTRGDRDEPPFFLERLEGQPPTPIAFGERDPALGGDASVDPAPTLGSIPGEVSGGAAILRRSPPLDPCRLRVPNLPVRPVPIYESAV